MTFYYFNDLVELTEYQDIDKNMDDLVSLCLGISMTVRKNLWFEL